MEGLHRLTLGKKRESLARAQVLLCPPVFFKSSITHDMFFECFRAGTNNGSRIVVHNIVCSWYRFVVFAVLPCIAYVDNRTDSHGVVCLYKELAIIIASVYCSDTARVSQAPGYGLEVAQVVHVHVAAEWQHCW